MTDRIQHISLIAARVIAEVAGTIATNGIQELDKTERGGVSDFGYFCNCLVATAYNALRDRPNFGYTYNQFFAAVLAQVEKDREPEPAKTAGQLAYERDLEHQPNYNFDDHGTDGPRPTWEHLSDVAPWTWEQNPTDRHVMTATHEFLAGSNPRFCMICQHHYSNPSHAAEPIKPQFPVGSTVCHRSFVDSSGRQHDAVTGLTVIESTLIEPGSIPSYYRIKAVGPNGRGWVEAAERFFDADAVNPPLSLSELYEIGWVTK